MTQSVNIPVRIPPWSQSGL